MPKPGFVGEQLWCPICKDYTRFIKSAYAARLAAVHRRTIYRYIEEGLVYTVKVAGRSLRICSECLFRRSPQPESDP